MKIEVFIYTHTHIYIFKIIIKFVGDILKFTRDK